MSPQPHTAYVVVRCHGNVLNFKFQKKKSEMQVFIAAAVSSPQTETTPYLLKIHFVSAVTVSFFVPRKQAI
jgi:hypothetical protein